MQCHGDGGYAEELWQNEGTWDLLCGIGNWELGIGDWGFGIWDLGFGI
jgi:hypothetical protein